jgi:DNA-binding transcriptional MerR regulator
LLERLTVQQAARQLGVSEGAIRMRLSRGSLEQEKDDSGRVWVLLRSDNSDNESDNTDNTEHPAGAQQDSQGEIGSLVEVLREQVGYLREQLAEEREARRRADTIIAQLTQANATLARRVPELEAAPASSPEPRDAPETPFEKAAQGDAPPGGTEQPRREPASDSSSEAREPWWRRWFGG